MKALTVLQPYAEMIATGEKWIENRTWATAYRGQLVIHAGAGKSMLERPEHVKLFTFGAVVAVVTMIACVHKTKLSREQLEHEHAHGPWCWVFADVRRVGPIPYKGAQGLWVYPGTL